MKKDRNCPGSSYPIYPNFGGYMPQMPIPMTMMPMGQMYNNQTTPNYQTQDNYSSLQSQINNLEKRVSRLESSLTNQPNSTYSESNFYMV